MRLNLVIEFEIFDTSNDNELINTKSTYADAVELAKTNPNYAVDMTIDLQHPNGESAKADGDYLYTVQVYPVVKQYDNHDMRPIITEHNSIDSIVHDVNGCVAHITQNILPDLPKELQQYIKGELDDIDKCMTRLENILDDNTQEI